MFQKENIQVPNPRKRDRKGYSSKATGEGNDYILKRYKLEQNKLFRQKQNQQLKYQVKQPAQNIEDEQQIQDDIIIVPIDLPSTHSPQKQEVSKHIQPQEIFVFDDDEQQVISDKNIQELQDTAQRFANKQDKIKNFKSNINSQQISLKGTSRGNYSNAQLMTPKIQFSRRKNGTNPNQILDKLCKDEQQKPQIHIKQSEYDALQDLKGVKIGRESNNKNISITITDKKLFSLSKLPSGIILQCKIKRTSSILNLMSPQFDLYLANGLKHVLSAKKYPLRNRQLFRFSVDPVKFTEQTQLAVMHANVNHNIYWVLDRPRRIGDLDLSFVYIVVGYYKLKDEQKHQRKMSALLPPSQNAQYQLAMDYQLNNINFSNIKQDIKTQITNLQFWKNQSYNSTKNFVMADEDDPDYRYLQMKKQNDDVFELTIQHPLSPLQAMALAMTRFDAQLK